MGVSRKVGCNAIKSAGKLEYTPQAEGFAPFCFGLCVCVCPFSIFQAKTYRVIWGIFWEYTELVISTSYLAALLFF